MLRSKIVAAKTVIDIVGLIPELRLCKKNPKIITAFYDKVKEITSLTTDEIDLGIIKTNFIDHPAVDSEENKNLAIFILQQFIATAKSEVRLQMIVEDINNCADPSLISYYEEAKASFGSPEQN
ncbi:hypothetical protein SDC9_88753 [bioreactor metagenome]|uniref:Uncharacterized protein n=1 Tax=bioreactor metagenome TaxID=1076179 RepID=A0A644ZQC8_9ZZZZ